MEELIRCHQCNCPLNPEEEVLLGNFCYCSRCSEELLNQLPTEPHLPLTNYWHILLPPYVSTDACKDCTYAKKDLCDAYLTTNGKSMRQSDVRQDQTSCRTFQEKFRPWPLIAAFAVIIICILLL